VATVQNAHLHFFVRSDIAGQLRAYILKSRAPSRKMILENPLAEWLADNRRLVHEAETLPDKRAVSPRSARRNSIDHAAGESDIAFDPLRQASATQLGKSQQSSAGNCAIAL
jgi:hypothetical protein